MRIRNFMLVASSALVVTALMVQACGGDPEPTPASPVDSGAAETAPSETADSGGDAGTSTPCDTTSDFLAAIPDASLADGATTSGLCIGCLASKCSAPVDKCGADCNCRAVVADVLDCFSQGGDLGSCFTSSVETPSAATQALGLAILSCVSGTCKEACAGAAVGF
jgi:hypothetical protein